MTEYALRLASLEDTAPRVRMGDTLTLAPNGPLEAVAGLRPDGGGVVTIVEGDMAVDVAPFIGWVDGQASSQQGGYPFVLDATKRLTITDGDAAQQRIDTIVAQVWDTVYDNSGMVQAQVHVVQGAPGGSAPAVPAGAFPLWDVIVPAGASTGSGGLTAANRGTDRRRFLAAVGGILPVVDAADRDALDPVEGRAVYRLDTGYVEVRQSGAWEALVRIGDLPQSGKEFFDFSTAALEQQVNITFPEPFDTVPIVQASCGGGGAFLVAMPTAITTTGFTARIREAGGNNSWQGGGNVQWIAHRPR